MIRYLQLTGFLLLVPLLFHSCTLSKPEKEENDIAFHSDSAIFLENNLVRLKISLLGGDFVEFSQKSDSTNVFSWKQSPENNQDDNTLCLQGQFVSIGRWGKPTPGEASAGMPPHGEPANNWWVTENQTELEGIMNCDAPLDGLSIERIVALSDSAPLFRVTETIHNNQPTGKNISVVQNLFFNAPFLDNNLELNSNATFGYNQARAMPDPSRYEYNWPNAFVDTLRISVLDLRKFHNNLSFTSSHIFSDTIAWITAYNKKMNLLLGYVWRTSDYSWLHIRNILSYNKASLKGIAFGTTGLCDKYSLSDQVVTTFHSVKNFDYLDARASLTKSWYCFLLSVPKGYKSTSGILLKDNFITLKTNTEKGIKEYRMRL